MKLSNTINVFLLFLLVVVIVLTAWLIYSVYEQQLTSAENLLSTQVEIAGEKIESDYNSLHEDFHFLASSLSSEDYLYEKAGEDKEKLVVFKRLLSKYQDVIDSIRLFDADRNLSVSKDRTSYFKFITKQSKNSVRIVDDHKHLPLTSTSFSLLTPLFNSSGNVTANLELNLNLHKYIVNELKDIYIGNDFCYWIIINKKIYVINNTINDAKTIQPTKFDLISHDIDDGLSGFTWQNIYLNKKSVAVLSSYYPINIGINHFGLVFSIDRNELFGSINRKIIYICISSFLLLVIMSLLFFIVLKERKKSEAELEKAHKHSIYMLAVASEYKDKKTGEHIKRISRMTTGLAIALGVNPKQAEQMGADSVLHDLGKLGIADNILLKPGKLTEKEFEIIKRHTLIGARIIGNDKSFKQASQIALFHHERWDGNGYQNGLKGMEIPLAARIVALVDVFDALTNQRPYKMAWPMEKSIIEIKQGAGTQFDPRVVSAFLDLVEKKSRAALKTSD
jgi:HD-GYP domain-containing protein (c-di-GMP phosphodiesterase class II)